MILLDRKQISAAKLAEIFEVSVRTIYRDITSLSEAGVPVTALPGVNGGIQIMDHYKIDKHFFTSTDITSLLIALESLSSNVSAVQANQTVEKIKTLVPAHLSEEIKLKSHQIAIDLTPWTRNQTLQPFLETIKSGIEKQQLLRFDYSDNQGKKTLRTVEPYRLVLKEISWYLQAFCLEREDFRTFKLSRISHLDLLAKDFTPREFHPTPLGKEPFYGKKWTTVTLKVTHRVRDQLIDKFGQLDFIETQDDDKTIVSFPFMEDDFGYHLLMGFGNQCECLEPNHVRDELKRRFEELLHIYQN